MCVCGGGGEVGVYVQNICYHAFALCDSLGIDKQHDHVLKKLNFDLLTPTPVWGMSVSKIFATILLHSRFSLI